MDEVGISLGIIIILVTVFVVWVFKTVNTNLENEQNEEIKAKWN